VVQVVFEVMCICRRSLATQIKVTIEDCEGQRFINNGSITKGKVRGCSSSVFVFLLFIASLAEALPPSRNLSSVEWDGESDPCRR